MTKKYKNLQKTTDFEREIIDIGHTIEMMKIAKFSKMYNLIYDREELIKIFSLYARHLKDLNKIIHFQDKVGPNARH